MHFKTIFFVGLGLCTVVVLGTEILVVLYINAVLVSIVVVLYNIAVEFKSSVALLKHDLNCSSVEQICVFLLSSGDIVAPPPVLPESLHGDHGCRVPRSDGGIVVLVYF